MQDYCGSSMLFGVHAVLFVCFHGDVIFSMSDYVLGRVRARDL